MVECSANPCTMVVFYSVPDPAGDRFYEAVYMRGLYHGARPGDDPTAQVAVTAYVGTIVPGEDVAHVHEVRTPHLDGHEVEREIRDVLAKRHGVEPEAVKELAKHLFPPAGA